MSTHVHDKDRAMHVHLFGMDGLALFLLLEYVVLIGFNFFTSLYFFSCIGVMH